MARPPRPGRPRFPGTFLTGEARPADPDQDPQRLVLYLPGSTLFLVWAHGRDERVENQPRRPWDRDLTGLLDLHADHTFLLKVSYWLNR